MRTRRQWLLSFAALIPIGCTMPTIPYNSSLANPNSVTPRWNIDYLDDVSSQLADLEYSGAYNALLSNADDALLRTPPSVIDKAAEHIPPSGNPHDYMSLSIYWWPNPNTPTGLPYIERDGYRNPEADDYDLPRLNRMSTDVSSLTLAWYLSGDTSYANKAVDYLRTWFLDPSTSMTPHLNYAQGIPGKEPGNRQGVVEGVKLIECLDAIGLLTDGGRLTLAETQALKDWFSNYAQWLSVSRLGREEAARTNNHGTWYTYQIAAVGHYIGDLSYIDEALGRSALLASSQFRPDGTQPQELVRTKSWDYSVYNLKAWSALADVLAKHGYDLWSFEIRPKTGLRRSLEFLASWTNKIDQWPYPQIGSASETAIYGLLRAGNRKSTYDEKLLEMDGTTGDSVYRLLFP